MHPDSKGSEWRRVLGRGWRRTLPALTSLWLMQAGAAPTAAYEPIKPTLAGKSITLTGHDLTIEQLIDIARHGARIEVSPEARQRSADAYGLLIEAAAEGVSIYWFNRAVGDRREEVIFA